MTVQLSILEVNSVFVILCFGFNLKLSKSAFLKAVGKAYSCCPEYVSWDVFTNNQGHSISALYKSLTALLIKPLTAVCTPLLVANVPLVNSTSFNSRKTRLVNVK